MNEPYLLHHLLEHTAKTAPNDTAVIDGDDQYDYDALAAQSRIMAIGLRAAGVKTGDRIGIFLPKSIDECAAIFAASLAGGVFVPINASLKPHQVRHILEDCGARALITQPELAETLRAELTGLETLTAILFPEAIENNEDVLPPSPALGEDLAAILYTSGSTGRPKGVMLSHRNLLAGTRIVRNYLGITPQDRLLSLLPFSFDYGLNQLLTTVEQGACLVLLNFKLGDQIVRALDRYEITGLAGVPTIWAMLTRASPSLARTPLPKLRYITNSGGAVPTETVRQLRAKLPGADIYLMYGLTEAFRSTFLPPDQLDVRPTSIGKAIPECEVFALTSDGRRAKPGEKGILVHRGPTVSMGYWNRPADTAHVLRANPLRDPHKGCDTVCWSGDIVTADEDGYLYFVGRDDAMIKSAGYRISPTEVEEAIMSTGGFREVAVIGLPDDIVGQKPHAVAVPLDPDIDTKARLAAIAPKLPAYMLPARIELVDALPRTPNGKVDYNRLVTERT